MRKIFYAFAALLMIAGLSSCNSEIKNVKTQNLVGTWDLVSTSTTFTDGTTTTTNSTSGEYIVISESTFTTVSGNSQTEYSFAYNDPHLLVGGSNWYDLKYLSRQDMILTSTLPMGILINEISYTYKRR